MNTRENRKMQRLSWLTDLLAASQDPARSSGPLEYSFVLATLVTKYAISNKVAGEELDAVIKANRYELDAGKITKGL